MTDTARHADVVLPATTQLEHLDVVFSWGHHYLTWNEPAIEPLGEAKPNTEVVPAARRAPRAWTRRALPRERRRDDRLDARRPRPRWPAATAELRERGWLKVDLGQGSTPHAEGGFGTATGRAHAARPLRPARRGCGRGPGRALSAGAHHAEDPPLPQLHVREPEAASTRPSRSLPCSCTPTTRAARGIADGARVRVYNDRGDFRCPARVSDDARPGVVVAPMGWWNGDYEGGRSSQTTTSQRAHRGRATPRSSTTTGWRSWRCSARHARYPSRPYSSLAARMRPTASSRRAREMRPRRTAASTAS